MDANSDYQLRVDERSMSPDAVTAYREMEEEVILADEIPRSWVVHPWRWCAAGYGGCCQHCPRDGLEDGMATRERAAGLQLTEQAAEGNIKATED